MLQFSQPVRSARADAIETAIGPSAVLKLRTGPAPANLGAADTGAVVATLNLPADWMTSAANGSKALLGTWQDSSADASGNVTDGHFRIYASNGTTAHIQGTLNPTSGTGDLVLDNPAIVAGQQVTITAFNVAEGNG